MTLAAYSARLAQQAQAEPVSPEAFVALACDPAACVVVRACAGAGKTWLLVARMARCLLAGTAPQDLLAITFTRKAAAEMEHRLLELLRNWSALDDAALRHELAQRGLPDADAALVARARRLYPQLLASGRLPTVATFHGWFSQLLRAAPLRFGVPREFELLENEQPWIAQAWRRLFQQMQHDAALRAAYHDLVARCGRSTAQELANLVLQRRGEFMLAARAGTLASDMDAPPAPTWLQWRDDRIDALRQWARAWGAVGTGHAAGALPQLQLALEAADDTVAERTLRNVLLTGQGTPRSPRNMATKAVCAELERLGLAEPAQAWERLAADAFELAAAHEALEIERIQAGGLRVGAALLACYEQLKVEHGLLDFADLELHARTLLADADVSSWVQQRLDRRYRQVLIDEFQDTNPVQWQALQAWLGAYAGDAQRPSVFIVGDDKQSIYRFRRADPQVFEAAARFLREGFGAAQLSAQHTRRLSVAVRDWVNAVFAAAPAMDFTAHTSASGVQGRVALLPPLPPAAATAAVRDRVRDTLTEPDVDPEIGEVERDARRVAELVAALLAQPVPDGPAGARAARPGDILLLLRKRKGRMESYLRALHAAGIPAASGDADGNLIDTVEAQDLLALLGWLVSPRSDLDFARVLKSPIGGLDDAALLVLARVAAQRRQGWWDAAQALEASDAAPPALAELVRQGRAWMALLRTQPPHDLLDRIVAERAIKARYARLVPAAMAARSLACIDAFVALALDLDGGRFLTPYAFTRKLKRGLARAPLPELHAGDAVWLSTIHGAKGLEADIVILADADGRPGGNRASVLLDWPAEQPHPLHFSLQLSTRRVHPGQRPRVDAELAAAQREDWNLLYVAMTRARRQLWVTCLPGGGEDAWTRRLAADGVEPATLPAAPAAAPAAAAVPDGADWPWLPRATVPPAADPEMERAARIGRAMHALLEAASLHAVPTARLEALAPAGVAARLGLEPGEASVALQAARRIAHSAQVATFFDPARVRWARNEVDVAWADGGWGRIDRLVELDDAVWVLDYKLATRSLRPQDWAEVLGRYADAASTLRPGKPVRVGLIDGEGALREWQLVEEQR